MDVLALRGPRCLSCSRVIPNPFGLKECPWCGLPFDLNKLGDWVRAAVAGTEREDRQIAEMIVKEAVDGK